MTQAGEGEREAVVTGRLAAWTRPLAIAGGFLMLAAALMVVVSVVQRWLTNFSVPGDIELVQIATAISVFAFLPLCQAQRGNIMVDTFTNWMPRRLRNAIDALWDLVYAVATGVIAWRLAVGAWETVRSHTVSMQLGLPIGWVISACAIMAALLAFVAVGTAVQMLRGRA
jgi:TRAP-type C4-dicarboxylate transport system permease small subunit